MNILDILLKIDLTILATILAAYALALFIGWTAMLVELFKTTRRYK